MEKNINYQCYSFSNNLMNLINNSGLPIFIIYLVLKDTLNEVINLKDQTLLSLLQDQEEKEEITIPVEEKEEE